MSIAGWYRYVTGAVKLQGDSTDALIGNVGDRLKTESAFADDSSVDAFARLRVTQLKVLYGAYFVNDERPLTVVQKEVGSASITRNTDTNAMELTTTTASGDRAVLQSREYLHYVPGHSFQMLVTAGFDSGTANCKQKCGYFDDDNGLFFQLNGTTMQVVRRTNTSGSVVDNTVDQSSWNTDQFDGNGPSGITVDWTKRQIFYIDFQWLGNGRVRWGIVVDGAPHVAHTYDGTNSITVPYMATANLPIRLEIENIGATAASKTVNAGCLMMAAEGEINRAVSTHAIDNGHTTVSINTSSYKPILSVRLKSAYNRAQIIPVKINFLATTNDDIIFRVLYNGSISGGSWVSAGSNSIAEYNSSLSTATGGDILQSGYVAKNGTDSLQTGATLLRLGSDVDGTADTLTVVARSLTSSANVVCSITFEELY